MYKCTSVCEMRIYSVYICIYTHVEVKLYGLFSLHASVTSLFAGVSKKC